MNFKHWIFENNEQQERLKSYEIYSKAMNDLAAKYKTTIHPKYFEHEKQLFLTMPIEDLRKEMSDLPHTLKMREMDFNRDKLKQDRETKREQGSMHGYYLVEESHERVVCSKGNPKFDSKGMTAYPMDSIDSKLKGYYGVHVGGGWLGILKRDGYCDSGNAYIYTIHADQMVEDEIQVYQMDDPHVSYRDSATPDSWIIFSKKKIIPAQYIELTNTIPERKIKEAPPSYGME